MAFVLRFRVFAEALRLAGIKRMKFQSYETLR